MSDFRWLSLRHPLFSFHLGMQLAHMGACRDTAWSEGLPRFTDAKNLA
jgi:hypothetical protein